MSLIVAGGSHGMSRLSTMRSASLPGVMLPFSASASRYTMHMLPSAGRDRTVPFFDAISKGREESREWGQRFHENEHCLRLLHLRPGFLLDGPGHLPSGARHVWLAPHQPPMAAQRVWPSAWR